MKRFIYFITILLIPFSSCSEKPSINVEPTYFEALDVGNVYTIHLITNDCWKVDSIDQDVTVLPLSGIGDEMIEIVIAPNTTGKMRKHTIIFSSTDGKYNSITSLLISQPNIPVTDEKIPLDYKIAKWYNDYNYSINFTWDDANLTHGTVDSIFNRFNAISTYFIQTSAFKERKYLELYTNIALRGNEIGSHTVHHPFLTKISIGSAEKELKVSSEDIYKYFGYYPASFAHPGSAYNTNIDEIVMKYYLSSRYSSIIGTSDRSFWPFRSTQNVDNIKVWCSHSLDSNGWIIFAGHGVNHKGYEPITKETLIETLKFLSDNYSDEVWITSFANSVMYKHIRENLQIIYLNNTLVFNIVPFIQIFDRYKNASAIVSIIIYNSKELELISEGIIANELRNNDRIVSIDLRKSNNIQVKEKK